MAHNQLLVNFYSPVHCTLYSKWPMSPQLSLTLSSCPLIKVLKHCASGNFPKCVASLQTPSNNQPLSRLAAQPPTAHVKTLGLLIGISIAATLSGPLNAQWAFFDASIETILGRFPRDSP